MSQDPFAEPPESEESTDSGEPTDSFDEDTPEGPFSGGFEPVDTSDDTDTPAEETPTDDEPAEDGDDSGPFSGGFEPVDTSDDTDTPAEETPTDDEPAEDSEDDPGGPISGGLDPVDTSPRDPYASVDGFDYRRIAGLARSPHVTPEFIARAEEVADEIGTKPEYLLAVMALETAKTFRPDIRNPRSSATGLIQFMATTAKRLGTTTDELAAMTAVEQLDYVEKYFRPVRGRVGTLRRLYTYVFCGRPIADADQVIYSSANGRAYRDNIGLDLDSDGTITAGEASRAVESMIRPAP